MSIKILTVLAFCIGLISCKDSKENKVATGVDEKENVSLTPEDISKLDYIEFELDTKTEKAIESWKKYTELQDLVFEIKQGNLSYFYDNKDGLITFLKEFKESIPESVNTSSILARITALETKLYKLESFSKLSTTSKQELNKTIKEFLVAFSNLNLQMNKKMEKDSQQIEKP